MERDDGTQSAFGILVEGHSFVTHDRHLLEDLHETLGFLRGKDGVVVFRRGFR